MLTFFTFSWCESIKGVAYQLKLGQEQKNNFGRLSGRSCKACGVALEKRRRILVSL